MTVGVQGCLHLHPAWPHSNTHACSPSPGGPSSRGHTRGTGVLWSLAGSDTDHSGGGTQSPWQLVHRHKAGSPGIAQSRSVLPVIHPQSQPSPQQHLASPGNLGYLRLLRSSQTSPSPFLHRTLLHYTSSSLEACSLPLACPILGPTPSPTRQRSQCGPVTPALHRQRPL